MLNDTIVNGLKPYLIGEKIRSLRLRKSMGLVELGKHTGLSAALLSKLERGKLFPTLPTLLRIALVFSVGLDYFFTDERKRRVVAVARKSERLRFPERPGQENVAYFFESLDYPATQRKISTFLADFQAVSKDKVKPHMHPGHELLYMFQGELLLTIGSTEYQLQEGDSIYFDAAVLHSYRKVSEDAASAIIVTAA